MFSSAFRGSPEPQMTELRDDVVLLGTQRVRLGGPQRGTFIATDVHPKARKRLRWRDGFVGSN
jgi:hypothetical protein